MRQCGIFASASHLQIAYYKGIMIHSIVFLKIIK